MTCGRYSLKKGNDVSQKKPSHKLWARHDEPRREQEGCCKIWGGVLPTLSMSFLEQTPSRRQLQDLGVVLLMIEILHHPADTILQFLRLLVCKVMPGPEREGLGKGVPRFKGLMASSPGDFFEEGVGKGVTECLCIINSMVPWPTGCPQTPRSQVGRGDGVGSRRAKVFGRGLSCLRTF